MILFDGYAFARQKETELKKNVAHAVTNGAQRPHIAAILFNEDAGSQLYTRLKKEAAERVGIQYSVYPFSILTPPAVIIQEIQQLNAEHSITGIIIQKPWRQTWARVQQNEDKQAFTDWWRELVSQIAERKDVDGLHPQTLIAIQQGVWQKKGLVLPATANVLSLS